MTQGSFAERLRVLRAQRGLALTEAAEQIGIDRHTLRDLELGGRTPRYPTLAKIAEGYDVPVEELLEEPVPLAEAPVEQGREEEHHALQLLRELKQHADALVERFTAEFALLETQPGSAGIKDWDDWDVLERDSALLCIGALSILRDDERAGRELVTVSETRRSARLAAERAVADLNAVCDEIEKRAAAAREAAGVRETAIATSELRRRRAS